MATTLTENRISGEGLRSAIRRLPRVKVADLPTPLHKCPRFSGALGGPRIFIKRDDATGLAFGGNKARKFDLTFGEAKKRGTDAVIAGAASQSNHSRQTAAAAAKFGMKAYLVLRRDQKSKEGIQGNLLLDHILGADVRLTESDQGKAKQELYEELRAQGGNPYLIGHYDEVLGTVAYSECALEIKEQLEALGVSADYIVLASGSGTGAGVALGVKTLGMSSRVICFRPSPGGDDEAAASRQVEFANEAAKLLGLNVTLSSDDIENHSDYAGEAYGVVNDACLDAIELLARTEGIFVDPVYVGKALPGLIDYVKKGNIESDKTVVFIHTGGTPALFAYSREFIEHGRYESKVIS